MIVFVIEYVENVDEILGMQNLYLDFNEIYDLLDDIGILLLILIIDQFILNEVFDEEYRNMV